MNFCPYFLHLYPSIGVLPPPQLLTLVVCLRSGAVPGAPYLRLFLQPNTTHRLLHQRTYSDRSVQNTHECTYKYSEP